MLVSGGGSTPPGLLAAAPAAGVALTLLAGNADETWLNAGAAEVQPCGTDNAPSDAARPTPAVTAAFPIPPEPNTPVPEPIPLPRLDPKS
jgi:hypothetical protein